MAGEHDLQYRRGSSVGIYDIEEEIRRLYRDYHVHVSIVLDVLSFGSDGRWLRVSCRRRGTNEVLGLAHFGDGVRGGARTFEGASYVALLNARETLCSEFIDGDGTQG